MIKRRRFQPGEPVEHFTADDYRAIVAEIERLSKLSVSAPLSLATSETGRVLGLTLNEPFWATLSGASSPYSWTEAIPQAGDTWMAGYQSGTTNAYEVNAHAGLSGKRVLLRATEAGDWRFQWVGYRSACEVSPFCVRDLPATAYVGDDLGTIEMNRTFLSDFLQTWESDILDYPVTTYEFDSGTSGPCHVTGDTGTVRYNLAATCNTVGANIGKITVTLKKLFWGRCCGTPPGTSQAGIGAPTIDRPLATASAVMNCGDSGVDITFPSTIAICPPDPSTMAMPGGGGIIPVTF